jgi:hypothetical protein
VCAGRPASTQECARVCKEGRARGREEEEGMGRARTHVRSRVDKGDRENERV